MGDINVFCVPCSAGSLPVKLNPGSKTCPLIWCLPLTAVFITAVAPAAGGGAEAVGGQTAVAAAANGISVLPESPGGHGADHSGSNSGTRGMSSSRKAGLAGVTADDFKELMVLMAEGEQVLWHTS